MNKIILFILIAFISCRNLRSAEDDFNFEQFQKEIVDRHNEYRKKHAASSLTVLKDLSTLCQHTVYNCKKIGGLQHGGLTMDDGTIVGQNLYLTSGMTDGGSVVDNWYSEIRYYDYDNVDKGTIMAGHFTQVVWKSTKQIGCAIAFGPWKDFSLSSYIGCNYLPAGNVLGQYAKNVSPPTS